MRRLRTPFPFLLSVLLVVSVLRAEGPRVPPSHTGPLPDGYTWRPQPTMVNSVGMRLVWIPPGSIVISDELRVPGGGFRDDGLVNARRFTLTHGFWIGAFEVTKREWCAVMPDWDTSHVDPTSSGAYGWARWWDASLFCVRLSHREGGLYRLPSEVEWEYACRACGELPSAWIPLMAQMDDDWTTPREVGRLLPNPWGLYDMLGNVREWCADDWTFDINDLPRDGAPFRRQRTSLQPLTRRIDVTSRDHPVRGCWFSQLSGTAMTKETAAQWLGPSLCMVLAPRDRLGDESYGFRVVLDGPPPQSIPVH